MRLVGALALVTLVACESQYGLYVTLDPNGLPVERVELHFGIHVADQIPLVYGVNALATVQKLYEHDAYTDVLPDVASLVASGDKPTYFVSSTSEQIKTAYVLAIGYSGDQPIAVGEQVLPHVPDEDDVFVYTIELEPMPAGVVLWGTRKQCFAWTRMRAFGFSSLALVPPDDAECRVQRTAGSCDALLECTPPNCPTISCVTEGCALGTCALETSGPDQSTYCRGEVCLDPTWCGQCGPPPEHAGAATDAFLTCWEGQGNSIEIELPYSLAKYCVSTMSVPLPVGLECLNPRILHPTPTPLTIGPGPEPGDCIVTLPPNGLLPMAKEHFLISVDRAGGHPTSLLVGAHLGQPSNCDGPQSVFVTNRVTTYPVCSP